MKKMQQHEKQFSLKDQLFNKDKVRKISLEILAVYPEFDSKNFQKTILAKFPEQELMERLRGTRDALREYLPKDYKKAVHILLKALPKELDPTKTDNDFGDFIYGPYSYYIATYGCMEKQVNLSLLALGEMTKRFSVEGAIRDFINSFPKETLAALNEWSKSDNYHQRRLASEGTRPLLPWAKRVDLASSKVVPILNRLHGDQTRYVTRSVANHLNDISKSDPDLVLKLLKGWHKQSKQESKELAFMTRHSLRTLIKNGHPGALKLLGYGVSDIKVSQFKLQTKKVKVGSTLDFSFQIKSESKSKQNLMVDYVVYFRKANNTLTPKTFKIGTRILEAGETMKIDKVHPFKLMSTRALYSGEHAIELQINGQTFNKQKFIII